MNSLALIQNYDSSDEEEVLVKKARLPPPSLPEYDTLRCISRKPDDNGERHEQRVRSFPHEAGNWATYVGISIVQSEEWCDVLDEIEDKFKSLPLKRVDNFHISLSRVVILKYHWINGFVDSIRSIISNTASFPLTLEGLSVFLNDEKTRTFLAIDVQLGETNLNNIVDEIDACLADYSLPKFYETRSFHASIFWGLGDISEDLRKILNTDSNVCNSVVPMTVNETFCKTGNKLYKFSMR